MRELGYAVRTLGRFSTDGQTRHPSRFLAEVADALHYCTRRAIRFYRIALPAGFDRSMIEACSAQLEVLAALIQRSGMRIGVHLAPSMGLAHGDAAAAARFIEQIEAAAELLARLDSGMSHTIVSHAGGADGEAGLVRFVRRYRALSKTARRRLTLEHSGQGYSLSDLCRLSAQCGIPLVFDSLHHQLHNPAGWSSALALGLALATWPAGMRAEVHLSSQRTEAHLLPDGRVAAPRAGQHADFVRVEDARQLLWDSRGLAEFDIMIEAKAGDLALLRLRETLKQTAPQMDAAAGTAMI